ncbi:MAG: hypothetical protein QHJ73_16815, partial [Armatimonadota bacterium]|nr:hypothetical protein [Armatimonadota bacterium]
QGKFLRLYSWWSGIVAPDAGGWTGAFTGWENNCAAQYAPELNNYKCTTWTGDLLDASAEYKRNHPDTKMHCAIGSSQNGGHWFMVAWEEGQDPVRDGVIIDPWATQGNDYKPLKITDALKANQASTWDSTVPQLYRNFDADNPGPIDPKCALTDDTGNAREWPEFANDQKLFFDSWKAFQKNQGKAFQPTRSRQAAAPGAMTSLNVTVVGGAFPLVTDPTGKRSGYLPDGTYVNEMERAAIWPGNPPFTAPRPVIAVDVGASAPQVYSISLGYPEPTKAEVCATWVDENQKFHEAVYSNVPISPGRQAGQVQFTIDPNGEAQPITLPDGSQIYPEANAAPVDTTVAVQEEEPLRNVLPPGLSLIAVPSPLPPFDAADLFGLPPAEMRLARWNPEAPGSGGYAYYPNTFSASVTAGNGYWVKLARSTPLALHTGRTPQTAPFIIGLKPGWNLIGNPFADPVPWDLQALRVRRAGIELSLEDAFAQGWVSDFAWAWRPDPLDPNRGSYEMVYDGRVLSNVRPQLEAWEGCWVLSYQACDLVVPPPSATRGFLPRQRPSGDMWTFELRADTPEGSGAVVLGRTKGTRSVA